MRYEKRAALVMTAAYLGAAATVLLAAATVLEWPDLVKGFAVGILIVSLVVLLRRKLRDEYFEGLWSAGASLAFVAVVVWTFFMPLTEGIFDGLLARPAYREWPETWAGFVCLIGFFTGFHLKRLRSPA